MVEESVGPAGTNKKTRRPQDSQKCRFGITLCKHIVRCDVSHRPALPGGLMSGSGIAQHEGKTAMTNNSTYGDDLETLGKALLAGYDLGWTLGSGRPAGSGQDDGQTPANSWRFLPILPDGSSQPKDRNTMKALVKLVRNVFKR